MPNNRRRATNRNISKHALAPTMRWLIETALDGSTMTYGAVAARLESESGFSTVNPRRIGRVAGELMDLIQQVDENSPLINVLLVSQKTKLPAEGIRSYMAEYFKKPKLQKVNYIRLEPEKWQKFFDRAAAEVYATSSKEWSALYKKVFRKKLSNDIVSGKRKMCQIGIEDDFGIGTGKYGSGGEGKFHKALRLWVKNNPGKIKQSYAGARTDTEFLLESGDRIDAVYHLENQTILLEVKSRISNEVDLRRGVYQCIKYRAVKSAMDVRSNSSIKAVLVTESDLSGEIKSLLKQNGIGHFKAPLKR